jgi:quinone-modifying oxidoreductase subunit QmoB
MLVEKEPDLGGHMAKWHKTTPTGPPYQEIEEITVQEAVDLVRAESAIAVHTGTTIEKISGAPGMFDVTLANGGGTHKVGSIVLAAGMKPYDATKLEHLSHGKFPISFNVQMEEMAKAGRSLALPTAQSPRSLHSSSARAPAIRTICRTAAQSAAGSL